MSRIAYLVGEYPAVSHTFILREVEALRELGAHVETCSIRETPVTQHVGPSEKEEAKTTFYVLSAAQNITFLVASLASIFTRPGRYLGALALAWKTRAPGVRAHIYQLIFYVEATILARHLRQQNITHLHNHFAQASSTVAMLAAHMAGIPYSFTLHGPADLNEPKRWRLDEKIARAKFVSCISHYARSQAMLHSEAQHWGKLGIVHCGVIPEKYEGQDGKKTKGPMSLVFVGRLSAVKGIRVLFEAFHDALALHPDMSLTLVGDGPDRQWLEQAAEPIKNSVTFTGVQAQDEVARTLADSDVLVLASFAEGVPVVLMEAMASGKPVIATQVAGVSELVKDNVNGLIVPPGDVDTLSKKITYLAENPSIRAKMGKAGRETVRAAFDVRTEAARLKTMIDEPVAPA